jgi:aldose sugar dehydrogenase
MRRQSSRKGLALPRVGLPEARSLPGGAVLVLLLVIAALAVAGCAPDEEAPAAAAPAATPAQGTRAPAPATPVPQATPAPRDTPGVAQQAEGPRATTPAEVQVEAIAAGLDTPWGLAFAPDGRLFFTERPGRVRVIEGGVLRDEPLITLPVEEIGEGGLMGLEVDPGFPERPYLYTKYTYRSGGEILNRVVRLRVEGSSAVQDAVLLDGIPGASTHNGGRVKVGPDGKLYVTTGDAQRPQLSQDGESLAGKVLRMELDGSVPDDNPIPGSLVHSLGHRNSQGLAWHPGTGELYATEHGPVGDDEVNLIEAGENYGWPEVRGQEHGEYRGPIAVYTPAVAPGGAAFYEGDVEEWRGSLFFATLRGAHLHRLEVGDDGRVVGRERLFEGEYGRLRDVVMGPDGALYVATSNRDGRGRPDQRDDRILRIR